jgi:Tfp pilus assembly protein PilF
MRIHARFAFDRLALTVTVALMAGCASSPAPAPAPPVLAASAPVVPEAAPAVPVATPAESALAQGVKAYQAAQYTVAETQLKNALQLGLTVPADVASAHKHLAFIYCTSRRESQCSAAFKAARAADPNFALTKSEAGHPMWGPVYRKALPAPKAAKPAKVDKAVKPQP